MEYPRPKLFIQTIESLESVDSNSELSKQVYAQTDGYSITPTTFQNRIFFGAETDFDVEKAIIDEKTKIDASKTKLESDLEKFKTDQENLIGLLEQMAYAVQDFEMPNIAKSTLDKLTTNITTELLTAYSEELEKCKAFLAEYLIFKDLYKYGSDEVTRFGINTSNINPALASIYTPSITKQASEKSKKSGTSSKNSESVKTLTPIEVFLLRKAVEHLETNKTVLVDIFDKENGGAIKLDEHQKLQIHTVVLYKNSTKESQIFIIDPSNSTFSKHLSENSLRLFGPVNPDIKIKTLPPELKIYSPPKAAPTGPEPYKYRDCIDIAVKIAFGLNHENILDVKNITSSKAISNITNQKDIVENLFFKPEEAIARIRQASNSEIRDKVHKLLIEADRQIKSVDKYFPLQEISIKIEKSHTKVFGFSHAYDQYDEQFKKLYDVYEESVKDFAEEIDKQKEYVKDLLGITSDSEGT